MCGRQAGAELAFRRLNITDYTSPCSVVRNAVAGDKGSRSGSGRSFARIFFSVTMRGLRGYLVILDDLGQLPDQRFGLFVCQFKVRTGELLSLLEKGLGCTLA